MNKEDKQKIFKKSKEHLQKTVDFVVEEDIRTKKLMAQSEKEFKENPLTDKYAFLNFSRQSKKRLKELAELSGSPYFVRCDVTFQGEKAKRKICQAIRS